MSLFVQSGSWDVYVTHDGWSSATQCPVPISCSAMRPSEWLAMCCGDISYTSRVCQSGFLWCANTAALTPTAPTPLLHVQSMWFWVEKAGVSGVVASGKFMMPPTNCSAHKAKIIWLKFNPATSSCNLISTYFVVLSNHDQRSVYSKSACPRLEGAEATSVWAEVRVS